MVLQRYEWGSNGRVLYIPDHPNSSGTISKERDNNYPHFFHKA